MSILNSKKTICIFAHPDDEAFGPAGTIIKLARKGEVQVICVTDGNSPGTIQKNLSEVREEELKKSCAKLGVTKIHKLAFPDGGLCNHSYHDVAAKIEKILKIEKPDSLITFEIRGLTGHLDHIATSMITTFVFKKLKSIKNLYYYCMSDRLTRLIPKYFVYFPRGFSKTEIDECVEIKDVWKQKIESIKSHKSQAGDIERYLTISLLLPKEEYFLEFKE